MEEECELELDGGLVVHHVLALVDGAGRKLLGHGGN